MKSKFKVGQYVKIKEDTFYPGLNGIKLVIKGIDAESGVLWVRECIKTSWSSAVQSDHVELYYLGTAVIRNTRNGQFRVNLTGKNGEKMYTSEPYATKGNAMRSARLMKDFEIVDKTK